MDISGLSAYTDLYQTQVSQSTSKLESELETDYTQATNDELMDACKEFEAYFVEQMFKEMQKTVPETEYSFKSTGTMVDYYRDSMIQEMASLSTETGGLGLAQMLYEQMKINNGSEA